MLGFFASKEDRVKLACIHLRNWFNPIKTKMERAYYWTGNSSKKLFYSFPIVRCSEVEMDKNIAGFHIYTKDGMITMEDESTEYKFPPEMLGRVINGLTTKKVIK